MEKESEFVLPVRAEAANELSGHKEGPGKRFVFSDEKNNPNGEVYTIVREVKNVKDITKSLNSPQDVPPLLIALY